MLSPLLIITGLISLIGANPLPEKTVSLEPRCGTFLAPQTYWLLREDYPDSEVKTTDFLVSQVPKNGQIASRTYLLVHFNPTPAGSYGCELHWNLPAGLPITLVGSPQQLDVKTISAFNPGFHPTWNNVMVSPPYPLVGSGTWGTCNPTAGANSVINTATCSNAAKPPMPGGGMGLNFMFKMADWVEQSGNKVGVTFPLTSGVGPYMNFDC
ncbi:hypothetical protein BGZ60DRAFT_532431 [Tricladium varicosporioides]|nr:hypothetical protein BGZ60DRAFT_532431 [Hymenoscyphus varicosporioides]